MTRQLPMITWDTVWTCQIAHIVIEVMSVSPTAMYVQSLSKKALWCPENQQMTDQQKALLAKQWLCLRSRSKHTCS